MAQQPLVNLDTFGIQRGKINANDADNAAAAAAATTAAAAAVGTANGAATAVAALGTRGAPNGVASLGTNGKVPTPQLTGQLALADLSDGTAQAAAITAKVSYIARTTSQLVGVPGAPDIALGASALFYDPLQTVDTTHPWVYYSAGSTGYVKINTSATGLVKSVNTQTPDGSGNVTVTARQLNAFPLPGTWNGTTNTAYNANSVSVGALASGTPPPVDLSFKVIGCPTLTTVSISSAFTSVINDDIIYFDSVNWQKASVNSIGIVTSNAIFGDGVGGARAGVPGVDYMQGALLSCNVPVASAPDGTIGANGALTLNTGIPALPGGSFNYGIWLYFPANAITGSNAAGFYWVVFPSTSTAGTIYNNVYTPGVNSGAGSWRTPTSLVAFSGTTGSAYTGSTAAVTTHSYVIPGNGMGPNGTIRSEFYHRNNNSAGGKRVRQMAGGNTLGYDNSQTTTVNSIDSSLVWNRGVTNVQESMVGGPALHSNVSGNRANIDTTANFTLTVTSTTTVSTDWIVIESVRITLLPGA